MGLLDVVHGPVEVAGIDIAGGDVGGILADGIVHDAPAWAWRLAVPDCPHAVAVFGPVLFLSAGLAFSLRGLAFAGKPPRHPGADGQGGQRPFHEAALTVGAGLPGWFARECQAAEE